MKPKSKWLVVFGLVFGLGSTGAWVVQVRADPEPVVPTADAALGFAVDETVLEEELQLELAIGGNPAYAACVRACQAICSGIPHPIARIACRAACRPFCRAVTA